MKRQLSSKITFISKIIVPVIVIFFWGAATFAVLFSSFGNEQLTLPLPAKFLFAALWLIVSVIVYWLGTRLMVVGIDARFLYVSNYRREITVPLLNIRDITESRLRGHPITIHFKTVSEFGEKITFIPKFRAFKVFGSHPVVAELKELAQIKMANQ